MNSPARARSSGSASVMSSPSKTIRPSVISRPGWPMTALASVDLPEPLGPISACISPERTVRSTPLRICLSPALTRRFSMRSSAIDLEGVGEDGSGGGERHELGERRALEGLDDAELHARPQQLGRAVLALGMRAGDAVARLRETLHRRDRALQGEDDAVHRDLLGGPGGHVAGEIRRAHG